MSTSLRKPAPAAPVKKNREYWDSQIRRRDFLKAQQLELDRKSAALVKEIGGIDRELMAFVDAEAKTSDRSVTLRHWRLSIVQVAKSVSWVAEFTKRLGAEAAEQLRASAGTRDKLVIESREPPPAKAA